LRFQKAKGVTIPKDVNKIIFEKIKPWEITLYIIVDQITGTQSINFVDEEDEISTPIDVKFYGDYESFIGFQAWIWVSLSYTSGTEILRERNKNSDNKLLLYSVAPHMSSYCLTSPNYQAFISGVAEAMKLSNIWTLKSQLANIYTVSPEIVKFCSVKKTAIDQLKREKGDDFDGDDVSKLKKRLKENNRREIAPEYIDQARLDYPCKFVY